MSAKFICLSAETARFVINVDRIVDIIERVDGSVVVRHDSFYTEVSNSLTDIVNDLLSLGVDVV